MVFLDVTTKTNSIVSVLYYSGKGDWCLVSVCIMACKYQSLTYVNNFPGVVNYACMLCVIMFILMDVFYRCGVDDFVTFFLLEKRANWLIQNALT